MIRFKGVCINEGKFPVTFKTISINCGLAQITETQTDMKGQFSFEWSFMKGSYTLSINAIDYQGEIPINITKEYLNPVIFPVKRIYFSQNKA
jgi:hypothetical protein